MAPVELWPAKPSAGTGIEDWLHLVEGAACWQRYGRQLSAHFDGVRQIEERFVITVSSVEGKIVRTLDPAFFALIGVEDARHQQLFTEWFAQGKPAVAAGGGNPPQGDSHQLPHRQCQSSSNGHGVTTVTRNGQGDNTGSGHGHGHKSNSSGRTNGNSNSHSGRNGSGAHSLRSANFNTLGESAPSSRTPYDWSLLSMVEWLREVDPGGGLLKYSRLLEESYDSVEQVMDVYVQADSLGVGVLDPQFFDDARVEVAQHQLLFARWFATEFGAQSSSVTQGSNQGSGDNTGDTNGSVGSSGEATTPPPRTPPDWRRVSVEEWLRSILEVFPARYAQRLRERYESAEDILRARVLTGSGCPSLDPQLFADAGIESKHHQRLIQDWLAREHGRGALLASVPEETLEALEALAVSGVEPTKGGLDDRRTVRAVERRVRMSCAEWLRLIDGAEAWMKYEETLANKFSDAREIEERYVSRAPTTGEFQKLDAAFFDVVGIADADHRQRFRDWFATAQVPRRGPVALGRSAKALPCSEWLRLVEGEDVWLRYGKALSATFDTVEEIERRFMKTSARDGHRRLDPAFFRVAGVDDRRHRRRFENWFKSNASATLGAPLESGKILERKDKMALAGGESDVAISKRRPPLLLAEPEPEL